MARMFPWRNIVMALVLSAVLLVGIAQHVEAKTSQGKHFQASLVYCSLVANKPKHEGQSITGSGNIDCNGASDQIWTTLQIQKSTPDGKWTTVGQKDDIGYGYASMSIACDSQQETLYRTTITGQYRTGDTWHTIPSQDQTEVLISCSK